MIPRHQVSRAALELIMRFEGYRRRAARLADGRWTIGYGHTLTAREGAEVSPEDAEALLLYDVRPIAQAVNETVYTPLTQNQFDALTAFAYNIGLDNFRRSAVLRRVNEGNLIQAACALEMWRKADFEGERIVVDALVRRRAAEKTMFLTPPGGWVPAPSPIVRPKVDYDVSLAMPRMSTDLESAMDGEVAEAHRAGPAEDAPASRAVAEALGVRLNAILPEEAVAVAPAVAEAAAPPTPEPVPEAPVASAPIIPQPEAAPALVTEPEPVPPGPAAAHLAEAAAPPAYMAAPALFGALFGREFRVEAPAAEPAVAAPAALELATPQPSALAPVAPELVAPQPAASEPATSNHEPILTFEPTGAADEALSAPAPTPTHDARFDIPERDPMDLSRRVVWREAPMETEAHRLLGAGLSGISPLWLLALFLTGLAVFGGGIVWGMSAKGSSAASWVLGLVGIICVVSAVYIYLERLGEREE